MKKYSPGALVFNNGTTGSYMHYHVTDVRYNDSGDELLVNVGNDHIYLFDMQKDRHTKMSLPGKNPGRVRSKVNDPAKVDGPDIFIHVQFDPFGPSTLTRDSSLGPPGPSGFNSLK